MTLFGIHEGYSPAQTLQRFPRATATREFTGSIIPTDLVTKLATAATPTWNAGMTCWWSVKLSVPEVTSNAWKPHVDALATFLRDNPAKNAKTVIVIWHEPEDDFIGSNAATNWTSYFNKIHGWLKAIEPSIKTAHSANSYWYRTGGIANPSLWRTQADIHATDVYSGNSFPISAILPDQAAFTRWYNGLVGPGNPYAVTERGWFADPGEGTLRADAIRAEAEWLATDPVGKLCSTYLYWNTDGQQADPRLILDSQGEAAVLYLSERITEQPPVERHINVTCPLCLGAGNYTFSFLDSGQ